MPKKIIKRLSKSDWLRLGLQLLADKGHSAMRIDILCQQVWRSKGSFYHHFKDRADFVHALGKYWQEQLTENVIERANQYKTPIEKLTALNALTQDIASGEDAKIERALRLWASSEQVIAEILAKVDKRRTDYVASLLVQSGLGSRMAIDLAVMNYAMLIGFQQMPNPPNPKRCKRIDGIYVQLLQIMQSEVGQNA